VEKAINALDQGKDSIDVVHALARNLTNKLLHKPTTQLKKAGEEGRDDAIAATNELFDLNKKNPRVDV
jgi:glutamyl-tRNA reductase